MAVLQSEICPLLVFPSNSKVLFSYSITSYSDLTASPVSSTLGPSLKLFCLSFVALLPSL